MNYQISKRAVFLILISLFMKCTNNWESNKNEKKKELLKDSLNLSKDNNSKDDTLTFNNIDSLSKYFSFKFDSIQNIRREYEKLKISNNDYLDSIHYSDSIFYELNRMQRRSIYKLILRSPKTSKTLRMLFYLLKDNQFSYSDIENIFQLFPLTIRETYGKFIIKELNAKKDRNNYKLLNEEMFTHLFYNYSNQLINLREINAEFLLLEFWASWCRPCRVVNRNLMRHKDYFDSISTLAIVGISLDVHKERWRNAIVQDKFEFINITDMKGWESPIVKYFDIKNIPYNILINKKGEIMAQNLSEEQLLKNVKYLK